MKLNFGFCLIFFVFYVRIITPLNGQTNRFDSLITKGIDQIYNINFDEAEKTFDIIEKNYPKHPAGLFFKAMITWWTIRVDMQNEQYDELFYEQSENLIEFCDDLLDENENNADAYFFKGGALGFRGWLGSIREDWFDAALDGKEALPLVYRSYEIDSSNVDAILGFGIYNYYADVIPEKYPFVKPAMIFLPDGDKKRGIEQLQFVAENGKFSKFEALYFLLDLNYKFEENFDEALKYSSILLNQFPNNPVFEKYKGRSYVKKGDYLSASEIFAPILRKCYAEYPGYNDRLKREAAYYVGNNYFNQNKADSALIYFTECELVSKLVDEDEASGFQISAILMIAKSYEKLREYDKADGKYEQLLELRDFRDSHKKAEESLDRNKRRKNPPKILLKHQTDG